MLGIKVSIVRYTSDSQPGFVECKFIDAWNKEFTIEDKVPIVTDVYLDENSPYPQGGHIACEIIKKWIDKEGRQLVRINIDNPWRIETIDRIKEFDIEEKDIIEF